MKIKLLITLLSFALISRSQTIVIDDYNNKCKKYTNFCSLTSDASHIDELKVNYGVSKVLFQEKKYRTNLPGNIRGSIKNGVISSSAWVEYNKAKFFFIGTEVNINTKQCIISIVSLENGEIKEIDLEEVKLSDFKKVKSVFNKKLSFAQSKNDNYFVLTNDFKLSIAIVKNNVFSFKTNYIFSN